MQAQATPSVSVAVLAGGQSRRMGTDKALLRFEGVPLLGRVLRIVEQVSEDVFIVGARPAYQEFGVRVVADGYPGAGPLGGIATALQHARHDRVLVVACDMPLLNLELLRALAREERTYQALVPALAGASSSQGGARTLEALHAIYAKSCLDAIEARIDAGLYRVSDLFEDVSTRILDEEWIRAWDPRLQSFVNTNNRREFGDALRLDRTTY